MRKRRVTRQATYLFKRLVGIHRVDAVGKLIIHGCVFVCERSVLTSPRYFRLAWQPARRRERSGGFGMRRFRLCEGERRRGRPATNTNQPTDPTFQIQLFSAKRLRALRLPRRAAEGHSATATIAGQQALAAKQRASAQLCALNKHFKSEQSTTCL